MITRTRLLRQAQIFDTAKSDIVRLLNKWRTEFGANAPIGIFQF